MNQEIIAQLHFWLFFLGIPLGFILLYRGFKKSTIINNLIVLIGSLAITHSIWYFCYLGVGLSDKTGDIEYPSFIKFHIIGAFVGGFLIYWAIKHDKQKQD